MLLQYATSPGMSLPFWDPVITAFRRRMQNNTLGDGFPHVAHTCSVFLVQGATFQNVKKKRQPLFVIYTLQYNEIFSLHISACYEAGVSHNMDPLEQRGLSALLKGPTVAAWQCWGLNHQPSGQQPSALTITHIESLLIFHPVALKCDWCL